MRSHRLEPDASHVPSADEVAAYGEETTQDLPTGVNHVQNHRVARAHPLMETSVGPYIKDVGNAPSVWHGVRPSVTREQVEDEWNHRQLEASMVVHDQVPLAKGPDPVPVFIVSPDVGAEGISSWNGGNYSVSGSVEIAGRDHKRTRMFIINEDATNSIRISRVTASQPTFGALIGPGKQQELATQDKVYAIAATPGTTVNVSVVTEFGINGGHQ